MSHPNRLADTTSPYLQQHAANPVDWWPWCAEALAKARELDKPILLSIGYSACHWCHVMAHESFEDADTAALMNELFVNIKVDREERPDLDKIYQTAHQLLARRAGGWPLTVFLTPDDQAPFFAGTYFPNEPRHGLISFQDLLRRVHDAYRQQQPQLREQNRALLDALQRLEPGSSDSALSQEPLGTAFRQLTESFDAKFGGFGRAPKFPHPTNIDFLLRHHAASGDPQALHMAELTLERMALGGMNDSVGGGFCRYSVDDYWMIPHFEKMLYDNAQLLPLYADAWALTGKDLYRETCEKTVAWLLREMQSPEGGFYSALDADSEGEEGKFYVWDREQLRELVSEDEYRVLAARYGLAESANFEGRWHLHTQLDMASLAEQCALTEQRARELLDAGLQKLFSERERRVRPGLDDKALTAWNALMIRGLAHAGRALGHEDWLAAAERALGFIRSTLWRNGRLLATYKDGKAHLQAYLDDHAFLLAALLELSQARWSATDLAWAIAIAEILLEQFEDPQGGFWFTANDHEQLIHRPKPMADEATPSGNGVAALALLQLGHILGEPRYEQAAERALRAGWQNLSSLAQAHASLLAALEEVLQPGETLILRGDEPTMAEWRRAIDAGYHPRRLVLSVPSDASDLPGLLAERKVDQGVLAYLCRGTVCQAPIEQIRDLRTAINQA